VPPRRAKQRPAVEFLEDRRLLAVSLAIADVAVIEGNSGTRNLVFTVTRSGDLAPPSPNLRHPQRQCRRGHRLHGRSGTVTIPAGKTTATISVTVMGNTTIEPNKTLTVTLSKVLLNPPATPLGSKSDFAAGAAPGDVAVVDINHEWPARSHRRQSVE